jgi:hypothetical protein
MIAFIAKNGTTHRVWNPRKADSVALAKALWGNGTLSSRGVLGIVVVGERWVTKKPYETGPSRRLEAYEPFKAGEPIDI